LLASVPYRNQLNFTFDGLRSAASNVEKLRNFVTRLNSAPLEPGSGAGQQLASEAQQRMKSGLEDDLNTAQAQAGIFDMVRKANAAMDNGDIKQDDVKPLLASIARFDEVFAVLRDDDAEKMKKIYDWALADGRENDVSPELREFVASAAMGDEAIQAKVSEMEQARKSRNFAASDAIRAELTAAGILVEQTREGIRWRRK
nr:cysteine--tRNA ligase [Terriglobales bacterium]